MQKSELIARVARRTGMSQKAVAMAVNGALDTITETLIAGERVVVAGFGTFEVRRRSARSGVHPRTKTRLRIAARRTPGFTPGNPLRAAVRAALTE